MKHALKFGALMLLAAVATSPARAVTVVGNAGAVSGADVNGTTIPFSTALQGNTNGSFATYVEFQVTGALPFTLNVTESATLSGNYKNLAGSIQLFQAAGPFSGNAAPTGVSLGAASPLSTIFVPGPHSTVLTAVEFGVGSASPLNHGYYFAEISGTGAKTPAGVLAFTSLSGAITASAVPEPSTWALMLLGFSGVAFLGARRRQAVAA